MLAKRSLEVSAAGTEGSTKQWPGASLVETHSAVVAFVGDRAYKLKKPVDLGFLDFSTREARERACHREVELNRRLAPDVYLGVSDVLGPDGRPCDHLVTMRRLPDDARLSTCIERDDDVTEPLHHVARAMAALHAAHPADPRFESTAEIGAVRERWDDGFELLAPELDRLVERETEVRIEHLVHRYLDGRKPLFDARIAAGAVRDGHGDLQADDIFLLDDGPRILDCLDFDDALRHGDVVADVAFLAMDLERLGRPDLADRFLHDYAELAGAIWPPSLAHHYVAYRAHIRAKVGVISALQHGAPDSPQVAELQALARRHLEAGRVRLVLVGGLPGTGKSTAAFALGDAVGSVVLRSDEIRQDLHRPDPERYASTTTEEVYRTMLTEARSLLANGETVILDASWADAPRRDAARAVARETAADLVELRCEAPRTVCDERIVRRLAGHSDSSEATPAVAHAMADRFAPWPEATTIDTARPPGEASAEVLRAFETTAMTATTATATATATNR